MPSFLGRSTSLFQTQAANPPDTVRFLPFFLFLLCLDARAQVVSESPRSARERFFVEGSSATVLYKGDRPWKGESGLKGLSDRMGPGMALGVGYRWSSEGDILVSWATGVFPGILTSASGLAPIDPAISTSRRSTLAIEYHHHPWRLGSLEPFVGLGLGSVRGQINGLRRQGAGPSFSMGIFRPIGPVRLGVQLRTLAVLPDRAADQATSGSGADALHAMLFSMRYALPARTHTLSEVTLSVPGFLDTGKEDVFVVETTLDPSLYDVSWELGDGRRATGQSIRHTYRQAGIYTVVARVSGPRKRIVLQSRVNVRDRIEPPRITTISHSPYAGFPGDIIRFEADLTGTDGQCLWAFGDGSSATTCRADHVFEAPWTYRFLLSVTNAAGSDTKTRTVRIASDACAGREMLAAVHFRRNSQELVLDMREILRDNFAVASRCPDRTLVVSGFAFDTEQQAEELALGRARAVMQYYRNLGMPTRSVQLGRAIVQSEEGWLDEPWEGRKVSSALARE